MCTLVTPFQITKSDGLTMMDASEELKQLVEATSDAASALATEQARHSVAAPIQIDLR